MFCRAVIVIGGQTLSCRSCRGAMLVIGSIEDPSVIRAIGEREIFQICLPGFPGPGRRKTIHMACPTLSSPLIRDGNYPLTRENDPSYTPRRQKQLLVNSIRFVVNNGFRGGRRRYAPCLPLFIGGLCYMDTDDHSSFWKQESATRLKPWRLYSLSTLIPSEFSHSPFPEQSCLAACLRPGRQKYPYKKMPKLSMTRAGHGLIS